MLITLRVQGEKACFRRREFAQDFISYDVMPPTGASRLLASIYSAPGVTWTLERLVLLGPLASGWGELEGDSSLATRRAWLVERPSYALAMRLSGLTGTGEDEVERHGAAFVRAMLRGEQARPAFLGLPECTAHCALLPPHLPVVAHPSHVGIERDLGWLPYDIGVPTRSSTRYFHAVLSDGVLAVPRTTDDLAL